jgi:hypothetical protein
MLSQVVQPRRARPAPAEPGPVIEHRLDESDAEVPRLAPIAVARSRLSDQIGRGAPWSGGTEAGRPG